VAYGNYVSIPSYYLWTGSFLLANGHLENNWLFHFTSETVWNKRLSFAKI